jgi:hypothetical protein
LPKRYGKTGKRSYKPQQIAGGEHKATCAHPQAHEEQHHSEEKHEGSLQMHA